MAAYLPHVEPPSQAPNSSNIEAAPTEHLEVLDWAKTAPGRCRTWLEARDQRVMRRVNRWRPPRLVRLWMVAATRGGDGWLWYTMALVVALFGGEQRVRALLAALLAASAGVAMFVGMKRKFRRK